MFTYYSIIRLFVNPQYSINGLNKLQYIQPCNNLSIPPLHSRTESCATILFSSFHASATYLSHQPTKSVSKAPPPSFRTSLKKGTTHFV